MTIEETFREIEQHGGVALGIAWYDVENDAFRIATMASTNPEEVKAILRKFVSPGAQMTTHATFGDPTKGQ